MGHPLKASELLKIGLLKFPSPIPLGMDHGWMPVGYPGGGVFNFQTE